MKSYRISFMVCILGVEARVLYGFESSPYNKASVSEILTHKKYHLKNENILDLLGKIQSSCCYIP